MANEWVLVVETEPALPFTVANATGIEKGTACKMTDPRTAAAHSADNDIFAGILKVEKIASDGNTQAALYRGGWWKATASGSITVGNAIKLSANANMVAAAVVNDENVIGIALETASDAETLLVELRPTVMNLA